MKKRVVLILVVLLVLCVAGCAEEGNKVLAVGALELELPCRLLGDEDSVEYRFFEGAALLEAELKEGDTEIDLILVPHTQVYRFMASGTLAKLVPISGQTIGWKANEVLLDRLELEAPESGWTWADLLTIAREAKAKDANAYVLSVGAADMMLYQYAVLHVDAAAGTLDHDAKLLKELLAIRKALFDEELVPRAFSFSDESMCLFRPCAYEEGVLPLPRLEADGPDIFDYEGYYIGIYSGSDQIEDAQELARRLAIPEAEGALPVGGMLHFASDLPAIAEEYAAGEMYIDAAVSEIRKALRGRLAD